ncbi:MAG TPA: acyltransferase family protein [Rhizomicrobium sp.]|jgi:glucan biosynthesis protein C|nr:acyltransferase family protein [Rhizomicrobium sp.]
MNDTGGERLHALDATRGFALLLGIFFHATVSFLPTPHGIPLWVVMDSQRSVALAVTFHVLHIFRMTTFFLIAGFFAHMSFHKKGARGFIADRLKRIGIPLVVGWPILFAAIVGVSIWAALHAAHGAPLPKAPAYPGFPAFPLTHLWFLYVLLLLYAATLILRGLAVVVDRGGRIRAGADALVRRLVENPLGAVVLAAPLAAVLYFSPPWLAWFGIMTPDSSLLPNAGAATGFFTAFAFGWLLHRQVGLLEVWKRRWLLNLALAVLFTAGGFAVTGLVPVLTPAAQDWQTAVYAACFTLSLWTWSFAVIGLALRFLSGYSAVRRYIADASYWLYLAHVPLVMALQVAVSQLDWPWWVKFPLILGVTFPVLFASYHLFVRYSFIGAILNGRRESPRKRSAAHGLPEAAR